MHRFNQGTTTSACNSTTRRIQATNVKWGTVAHVPCSEVCVSALDEQRFQLKPNTYKTSKDVVKCEGRHHFHGVVKFDYLTACVRFTSTGHKSVKLAMNGKGNMFNVFVDGKLSMIVQTSGKQAAYTILSNLNEERSYEVRVEQRKEGKMRTFGLRQLTKWPGQVEVYGTIGSSDPGTPCALLSVTRG